jgi:hypothetical protein
MIESMGGTFNRLIHVPTLIPRSHVNPYCINPYLDFKEIEDSYLRGDVLRIDGLLTDVCLRELRKIALESTIFFDFKKSYFGAYFDEVIFCIMYLLSVKK